MRHDASCEGLNATNSDTRELKRESPWHGASGASGGSARTSARGSGCSIESSATHTPRSVCAHSGTPSSLDTALACGRGPEAKKRSVSTVRGRAENRSVALSEAMDDEARSSAGGGDVNSDIGGGGGGGGGQRRWWGVPRRSGPGMRHRDSLSVETQAAAAEAAAEEVAAAEAAALVVASDAAAGPEVPALPLRNFGGRKTLPDPVAAQIQMHGLMLMQHWSSLTSMESERTQSRIESPRSRENHASQSPRLMGGMARVTNAAGTESSGVGEVRGAVDRLAEIAAVRPPMHRGQSLEQVVASSARPFALPRDGPSSEDAAELTALVHFVNELLSRGEAGGEAPLPPSTRSWALPLLSLTESAESHRHTALGVEDETRHLFTAVRDGSLLRLLLARGRAEVDRLKRGLHGSTEGRAGLTSRSIAKPMVIREDEEESSTAEDAEEASPGPRSEGASRAEALKAHGAVLQEAAAMGFDVAELTAEGLCAGNEAMVLALLWQLAHVVLLAPVNVHSCAELESLLLPGEEQSAAPDELLFRWLNHHLHQVSIGSVATVSGMCLSEYSHHLHQGNRHERVASWTDPNLRSGVAYAVLLDEVAPLPLAPTPALALTPTPILAHNTNLNPNSNPNQVAPPPLRPQLSALREAALAPRRARVLLDLETLGVTAFRLSADGIAAASPKLHRCLAAAIFGRHPGLRTAETADATPRRQADYGLPL